MVLAKKTMENIENMASLYYKGRDEEGNQAMSELIKNLSELIGALGDEQKVNELLNILKTALKAMEEKDYVYLADILNYEIAGRIEEYVKNK